MISRLLFPESVGRCGGKLGPVAFFPNACATILFPFSSPADFVREERRRGEGARPRSPSPVSLRAAERRGRVLQPGQRRGARAGRFRPPAPLKPGAGVPAPAGRGEPARRHWCEGPSGLPSAPAEGGFAFFLAAQGWHRTASCGSSRLAPQEYGCWLGGQRPAAAAAVPAGVAARLRVPARPAVQPAGSSPPQRRARTPGLRWTGVGGCPNLPPHPPPPPLAPRSPYPRPAQLPAEKESAYPALTCGTREGAIPAPARPRR